MPTRLFYVAELDGDSAAPDAKNIARRPAPEAEANLISSLCDDGQHMPVLDVDNMSEKQGLDKLTGHGFRLDEMRTVASSTPGHFHVYIDRPMPWEEYESLLMAISLDVIEPGYARASLERKATFVRKPEVRKSAQEIVLGRIKAERARQDAKWGAQAEHSPEKWLTILLEELGEAAAAALEDNLIGAHGFESELVQVAAIAIRALEVRTVDMRPAAPVARVTDVAALATP
jgi:hypothetical protein